MTTKPSCFDRIMVGVESTSLLWTLVPDAVAAGDTTEVAGRMETVYVVRRDHLGRRWGRLAPMAHYDGEPVFDYEE